MLNSDVFFLQQALKQAEIKKGFCAPNPSVGAIIVKDNIILASGYHLGPGSPHAEVMAIRSSPDTVMDTTMYVTLEPCCHWGRTPPCTDALIQAGIKRLVYGYRDPNPIVSGKGEAELLAAGIICEQISLPEIDHFYTSYTYWHQHHLPFVTAKLALSLDGKIASETGDPVAITGPSLQEFTHVKRRQSDAILTTVKTVIQDDPQLNVRHNDEIIAKPLYILDTTLNLPLTAKVLKTAKSITLFCSNEASSTKKQALLDQGIRCIPLEADTNGLNLPQVIYQIGQDGIHDLWVEAGGTCFASLIKQQLLQQAFIYIAPKWLGEGQPAFKNPFNLDLTSHEPRWQQIGNDVLCEIHW